MLEAFILEFSSQKLTDIKGFWLIFDFMVFNAVFSYQFSVISVFSYIAAASAPVHAFLEFF